MPDSPDTGASLSQLRSRAARNRWAPRQQAVQAVVPDPELTTKERNEQRLIEVTDDATNAYNAILAKPRGMLPMATKPGVENRRKNVNRSLPQIKRMCHTLYGDSLVTPKFWQEYFQEVAKDDFKSGRRRPSGEHADWLPSFEYLTRPKIMVEVFEKALSRG